ncbi:MAG: hypothetical protein AMXMBFR34_19640 [Myxococcaceae bacterium]
MEPVTLFLKPSFQIAVQPGTGSLEVQVQADKKPTAPQPPALQWPALVRWVSRH